MDQTSISSKNFITSIFNSSAFWTIFWLFSSMPVENFTSYQSNLLYLAYTSAINELFACHI
ncbi:MAG: hypothetical protein WCG25_04560 [bacterium]